MRSSNRPLTRGRGQLGTSLLEALVAFLVLAIGMLTVAQEMRAAGRPGSVLSLLCDAGERYLPSYHDAEWVRLNFGDIGPALRRIDAWLAA